MVPPMADGAARLPFFLDVCDFTARRYFAVAADDAAASESSEAEKSNETHVLLRRPAHTGSKLCAAVRVIGLASCGNSTINAEYARGERVDMSAIVSELRASLREAVARGLGTGLDRERLGEVVRGGTGVRVLKGQGADVDVGGGVSRVRAQRGIERSLRALAASQRRTRRAEEVLGARVIRM